MIDPKQIPDEVVEAMRESITDTVMFINEKEARAAIVAALNAWPGAALAQRTYPTIGTKRISLPIPQEGDT
jgi:hypothetical protein